MGNKTVLFAEHQALNAKIVDFGGWDMPINYGSQIEEHNHVRNTVGMFDVSHMTVVDVTGKDAKAYLQYLLANDVERLTGKPGKALYSGMLNEQGGVIDDLIVYNQAVGYRLVVNCGTREKDLAWMAQVAKAYDVSVTERPELAIVAVQGPEAIAKSQAVLERLNVISDTALADLAVFTGIDASGCWIARTGYTGEDGLEMIVPQAQAVALWQALLAEGVNACGLGARDTLRLEAGMNLYGHEMDDTISPLEANMAWTIAWQPAERDFVGRGALEQQKADGIASKLVGLILETRGVLRAHQSVIVEGSDERGEITSGTFSPSLGKSVALARVPVCVENSAKVEIRGKQLDVTVVKPCFVRNGKCVI